MSAFPERLSALRKRVALTQSELATKVGVSEGTMQNWEAGRAEPRNNLVWESLAKALGCSVVFVQHGIATDHGDALALEAQSGYGRPQESSGHALKGSERMPLFSSRTASRADCLALVEEYLDAAEADPNGLPHAYKLIQQHLRPEVFTPAPAAAAPPQAPPATPVPGHPHLKTLEHTPEEIEEAKRRARTRVNYPARPEVLPGREAAKGRA